MCWRPYTKKDGSKVPCQKCSQCVSRRVSAWSFRLMQEEKVSTSAHFITLTYDTSKVPIADNGLLTLCKRDLQLFFKRLRKCHGVGHTPIKYYAVGEYGGKTRRPHYHVVLFNAKLELIQGAWNNGDIHYGNVTGASVGYTMKYMSKPSKFKKWCKHNGLQPEFALMSKRLGLAYVANDLMYKWHHADLLNRMYCVTLDGVKLSMPRYYKDKMYDQLQRLAVAEAQAIVIREKQLTKLERQSFREFCNEQKSIDATYDRMYLSSLKTKV